MTSKAKPEIDKRIAELHRLHKTEQQISTVLAREGTPRTSSGVHRALVRMGLAKPRKRTHGPVAREPKRKRPSLSLVGSPSKSDAKDDGQESLKRVLTNLEKAATLAGKDGDVQRVVQCQRAMTQAIALAAKLAPPPERSIDERPDMLAAAARCRDRMKTTLARILQGDT